MSPLIPGAGPHLRAPPLKEVPSYGWFTPPRGVPRHLQRPRFTATAVDRACVRVPLTTVMKRGVIAEPQIYGSSWSHNLQSYGQQAYGHAGRNMVTEVGFYQTGPTVGIKAPELLQLMSTAGQSHPTERLVPYCRGPLVESNKPRERLRSTPGW